MKNVVPFGTEVFFSQIWFFLVISYVTMNDLVKKIDENLYSIKKKL